MAEGRSLVYYRTDIGALDVFDNTGASKPAQVPFRIPNNLALQAEFAWAGLDATLPPNTSVKSFTPRHVIGRNAAGKRVRAIVPSVIATLWTGAVTTWTYIDNFGATQTATVTGYVGEAATV